MNLSTPGGGGQPGSQASSVIRAGLDSLPAWTTTRRAGLSAAKKLD